MGRFRRFGRLIGSGEFGKSSMKGMGLLEPQSTREAGRFRKFGKFWGFGTLGRIGRLGRLGRYGRLRGMGRLEKNDIRGKIWEPFGTQEGSGDLCVWGIWKIGKFRRL